MANTKCGVCLHADKAEIEEAYLDWHSNSSICREFKVSEPYLKAHARVFEWNKRRSTDMDRLYVMLFNELGENFDPSQLAQKDILNALKRFSGHTDRLQGRIVDRSQVDQRKTVTFIAIPLAGGSAPLLPESKQKVLASGAVLDASFEPEIPHGQEESFANPSFGLSPEKPAGNVAGSLAEAPAAGRRGAPPEEKGQE